MGPIKCALEMAAVNLITRSNSGLNSGKGGARDWMRSNKTSRTEISTRRDEKLGQLRRLSVTVALIRLMKR